MLADLDLGDLYIRAARVSARSSSCDWRGGVVHDTAADHRDGRLDLLDLVPRNRQVIAIDDDQIDDSSGGVRQAAHLFGRPDREDTLAFDGEGL